MSFLRSITSVFIYKKEEIVNKEEAMNLLRVMDDSLHSIHFNRSQAPNPSGEYCIQLNIKKAQNAITSLNKECAILERKLPFHSDPAILTSLKTKIDTIRNKMFEDRQRIFNEQRFTATQDTLALFTTSLETLNRLDSAVGYHLREHQIPIHDDNPDKNDILDEEDIKDLVRTFTNNGERAKKAKEILKDAKIPQDENKQAEGQLKEDALNIQPKILNANRKLQNALIEQYDVLSKALYCTINEVQGLNNPVCTQLKLLEQTKDTWSVCPEEEAFEEDIYEKLEMAFTYVTIFRYQAGLKPLIWPIKAMPEASIPESFRDFDQKCQMHFACDKALDQIQKLIDEQTWDERGQGSSPYHLSALEAKTKLMILRSEWIRDLPEKEQYEYEIEAILQTLPINPPQHPSANTIPTLEVIPLPESLPDAEGTPRAHNSAEFIPQEPYTPPAQNLKHPRDLPPPFTPEYMLSLKNTELTLLSPSQTQKLKLIYQWEMDYLHAQIGHSAKNLAQVESLLA